MSNALTLHDNPSKRLRVAPFSWDSENRLLRIDLPAGGVNTMEYRPDGLRSRLFDSDGDKRMVWDSQGSSGYQDLLDERLP